MDDSWLLDPMSLLLFGHTLIEHDRLIRVDQVYMNQ